MLEQSPASLRRIMILLIEMLAYSVAHGVSP